MSHRTDPDELLERARVVGVLDAWADNREMRAVSLWKAGGVWHCKLSGFTIRYYEGPTSDAARAAAAQAIESGELR